jgi:hypothetical protein
MGCSSARGQPAATHLHASETSCDMLTDLIGVLRAALVHAFAMSMLQFNTNSLHRLCIGKLMTDTTAAAQTFAASVLVSE